MIESEFLPYAIPSLIGALFSLCLGIYVFHKDPKEPLHRLFMLFACLIAIWGIGEFVSRMTPSPAFEFWNRIGALGWCLFGSMALHLMLIISRREYLLENRWMYIPLYGPAISFLYLVWTTDLITQPKGMGMAWGYTAPPGNFLWTYAAYISVYVLLAAYFGFSFFKKSLSMERRTFALFITGGIIIPFTVGNVPDLILPMIGIPVLELASLFVAAGVGIVAFGIIRYGLYFPSSMVKFFIPMPEARLPTKSKYKLEPGRSYLVKEKEPKRSVGWFRDAVSHGTAGVWVTSRPPRKLERKQGLVKTLIISVTAKHIRGEVTVQPDKLERIMGILLGYLERAPRAVVLLDCLRELTVANGFKKAFGFLKNLRQICLERSANLIVPIDFKVFPRRCVAELESLFKV